MSENRLADHLSVDGVRTADADEVREATGWSIGGATPADVAE